MDNGNKSKDLSSWLSWDGKKATIDKSHFADFINTFPNKQSGRMKFCASFDDLTGTNVHNSLFGDTLADTSGKNGTARISTKHFDVSTYEALKELSSNEALVKVFNDNYAEECGDYEALLESFVVSDTDEMKATVALMNPMNYTSSENGKNAEYFRIRTGAMDADTSYMISMNLGLKLAEEGADVDFAYVWNCGHTNADYKGELIDYVKKITPAPATPAPEPDTNATQKPEDNKNPGTGSTVQNGSQNSNNKTAVKKPAKVKLVSVSALKGKKLKIKWKKDLKVTGYQFQYSTNKKFKKKVTVTKKVTNKKTNSKTIKKLKKGKKYYIRVRAYKTVKVNGKKTTRYGSWSNVKSKKVKK